MSDEITRFGIKQHLNLLFKGTLLLAAFLFVAADPGGFVIFKGQINGPVKDPGGVDPAAFALKRYPGIFWSEGYYHHLNFPDGSMITVSIGFNIREANIAFVYGKPGQEPFTDYLIADVDDAVFDDKGFGFAIGKNRVRLEGSRYTLDLELSKSQTRIVYDIVGPSYTYGDGMVRYPDDKGFTFYNLPISWAKANVHAVLDGKEYDLAGSGNMNHDAGVIFPAYTPSQWQVFWFFGKDHALAVTDFYTHRKFGRALTQRLVFVDKDGREFTSTSFGLKWDDWEDAKGIPFRYPRHYTLHTKTAEAELTVEAAMKETLLMEDLYSNLPGPIRLIAERLTPNGWTVDGWADYTLTYTHDGQTDSYQGRGVTRWTDLEGEKK